MTLTLNNITKRFDDKTIFQDFSFTVDEGKIMAVVGESGVGKTTLLRILAGLDRDFLGKITPKNYKTSVAFQEARLYPGATVMENLLTVTDFKSAESLLLEMGIEKEEFNLYPHELSGGMARRVSLARALLYKADIYLIDEPFSGLDGENTANVSNILCKYLKGKTSVVVTHNAEFAENNADIILNLNNTIKR